MLECENWNRDVHARGDGGDAYGLCQMNKRYHKDIPVGYYEWVWQVQLEYCYQKRSTHTVFYWPTRIIKWMKCKDYVKDRFTYTE